MARLCLALLRNSNSSLHVVQESVRNFDMVSYYNGQLRLSVFCLYAYYSPTGRIGANGLNGQNRGHMTKGWG